MPWRGNMRQIAAALCAVCLLLWIAWTQQRFTSTQSTESGSSTVANGLSYNHSPPRIKHNTSWQFPINASLEKEEDFVYRFIANTDIDCKHWIRAGKIQDGGWNVCVQWPYTPNPSCLVYSFGINYDYSFDDAMVRKYHCQVHAFDPSMKLASHNRTDHIQFYNMGLSGTNHVNSIGWELNTLGTILNQLNHQKKTIDYLKFDIEESEWPSIPAMIQERSLSNVKQIGFEIHMYQNREKTSQALHSLWKRVFDVLSMLEKDGFRKWSAQENRQSLYKSRRYGEDKIRALCWELVYVNTHFMTVK